mmetsp:Transcript_33295/g.90161  ORF Transcript_33295/g.90161 Transcript_33295/m.90161 type:complete len:120 (-) Transcript_33295:12-371(-)
MSNRFTGSMSPFTTIAMLPIGALKRYCLGTPAEYTSMLSSVDGMVQGANGKTPPHAPTLTATTSWRRVISRAGRTTFSWPHLLVHDRSPTCLSTLSSFSAEMGDIALGAKHRRARGLNA